MGSEWFKDWFNSNLYLKVYNNRDTREAGQLFDLIRHSIAVKPGNKVLDLACGAGRHSLFFAKSGCLVTGVDISKFLLNEAKKSFEDEKVPGKFILSDLRDFQPDKGTFDLALNLFTSFGYFTTDEENFHIFDIAKEALHSSGYFIFDYFNIRYLQKHLVPFDIKEVDGVSIQQSRTILNNRVEKQIVFKRYEKTFSFTESVQLYAPELILEQLTVRGFRKISLYGSYTGAPFNDETSSRMLVVVQKV